MKMHIFIKGLHTLNTVPYDMIKKILMYKALSLSLSAGILATRGKYK